MPYFSNVFKTADIFYSGNAIFLHGARRGRGNVTLVRPFYRRFVRVKVTQYLQLTAAEQFHFVLFEIRRGQRNEPWPDLRSFEHDGIVIAAATAAADTTIGFQHGQGHRRDLACALSPLPRALSRHFVSFIHAYFIYYICIHTLLLYAFVNRKRSSSLPASAIHNNNYDVLYISIHHCRDFPTRPRSIETLYASNDFSKRLVYRSLPVFTSGGDKFVTVRVETIMHRHSARCGIKQVYASSNHTKEFTTINNAIVYPLTENVENV